MRFRKLLRCFFLKSSGIFFLAWVVLGGMYSAKFYGHIDQARSLLLVFLLLFALNGAINYLTEDAL